MHLLVTLDLLFKFFPAKPEFLAMWGISGWAKLLWAATCAVGAVAVLLLRRRAWLGFFASIGFCVGLYFASVQLWGAVKGGFWLAVGVTALALIGAVRSNNSFKPNPLRGSA
ncbi:hypothetical protein LMG920_12750 [Xanthomonas vesicatoria]|nr:hypothetical protein LMG920_12750 [Xanthomonas vesicatoria]